MNINDITVSPDEFRANTGIDLSTRLNSGSNPSESAIGFISMYQRRLNSFIQAQFHRNIEIEYRQGLSDYQKTHYKNAVIEFCYFIFKNGDIGARSGIDDEGKIIANQSDITSSMINPYTKNELVLAGLWCTHISWGSIIDYTEMP